MRPVDYNEPWYHGSPQVLRILSRGSWVTQSKEMAKAFSHKPSCMSLSDDCSTVKHNGVLPGRLYTVSEPIGPQDVTYLPGTAGTHWQTQRDLQVALLVELPVDDPPLLSDDELARLREVAPEGTTGFIGDPD